MTDTTDSYQFRMRFELNELKDRCAKIEVFMATETFADLSDADQILLEAQTLAMINYYTFLAERVERLNAD